MASKEARLENSIASTMTKLMPTELIEHNQRMTEAILEMQKQGFAVLEQSNRNLLERFKSDADFASEMATRLTAASSSFPMTMGAVPDVTKLYQEWLSHRTKQYFDDCQKLMDEGQKLTRTSARILSDTMDLRR